MKRRPLFTVFAPVLFAALILIPPAVISQANAQDTGYKVHRPIIGGATRINPWGALADIAKQAIAPYGWDVQVCYNCAGAEKEVIDVETKVNPATAFTYNPASLESNGIPASLVGSIEPPPPNGPVDFGVAASQFLWWGYSGQESKAGGTDLAPFTDLRLVATVASPVFMIVAATVDSGITDLSQVAGKPLRVITDGTVTGTGSTQILAYYGISKASLQAAGGALLSSSQTNRAPGAFDIIIYTGELSEAPEFNIWYQVSQTSNLTFLQLPKKLLHQLVTTADYVPLTLPIGYLKGMWQPIQTVGFYGNSYYGRTDMPESFAYDLARSLDENKLLFETGFEHYAYDSDTVYKAYKVPLAGGARRYYKEKGYITTPDAD